MLSDFIFSLLDPCVTCKPRILTADIFYRSQVIVLPIQKVSLTFMKANLRRKNFCLGLRSASMHVLDTFRIGKTMTCDQ